MASTLDLYIDTASGSLIDGGSVVGGALPTLTRNDTYTLRLRLLEKQPNGSFDDIDLSSSSLKAAIGNIEEAPSGGSFKLNINGITSSAIPFNATAISVYNAISNNVSTVALYGSESFGSYLLTATQPNTAMSFGSDSFTLFPTSSVLIGTRRNPVTSVEAQQIVKLVRNPIVYADTFTTAPTTGEIVLTKLQDGSASLNETYELTVGPRVLGGSYALAFGPNATTGIQLFANATSVQTAISSAINTITANCSVIDNGKLGYIISFTGRLGLTNITTALTLDSTGVNFIPFQQTTLTINTAEVEDAFADSGESTITPTLEIELTQGGTPKTVFQGNVTLRKDLITAGSTVPGNQAAYYTKSEADATFIGFGSGGINAADRALLDSTSVTSIHYGNRTLNDSAGNSALTWANGVQFTGTKLGFYNTAVTIQPASTNVVSALVNLGLIASSVTVGGNAVSNTTSNVDATGRTLRDATNAYKSVDYGQRILVSSLDRDVMSWGNGAVCIGTTFSYPGADLVLKDTSSFTSISVGTGFGSKIGTSTSQKLGFFNSTPIVQPSGINAVSGLINLGLLATGTTYGVLPQSNETLTVTTSINFGTVPNNGSTSVTITMTGASVNDTVLLGLPATIGEGLSFLGHVVASGQVHVDAVNATNSSIATTTATYRITVIGY
jgi:hypothetical protein